MRIPAAILCKQFRQEPLNSNALWECKGSNVAFFFTMDHFEISNITCKSDNHRHTSGIRTKTMYSGTSLTQNPDMLTQSVLISHCIDSVY